MQIHTRTHRPSPYKKVDMVLEMRNHIKHTQTSPYEWSAGYIPLAVIAGVVMLGAAIPQWLAELGSATEAHLWQGTGKDARY